jgi:N-methylhydantoinase A
VAVDVGGTFTDLVLLDAVGSATVVKVPSVPADPSLGVLDAVDRVAERLELPVERVLGNCRSFVHGSTVATNAVLEHKLARVGLLTTAGFRDALGIRRGIRADQWDHRAPWPPVIVPRHRRLGVGGRIDRDGSEVEALDEDGVRRALARLRADAVEAVAISFLHSYRNPAHERRAAALARELWPGDLTVTSSDLVPLIGEYERTSTAVVNAGLVPIVGRYLRRLDEALRRRGLAVPLLLIQSNGGTVPLDAVASRPVDLMLSGPAAVGGALRRSTGGAERPMVSMEIGGTSCDVAVMSGGDVAVLEHLELGGYHLRVAAVDVHSVGAGGGTLARVDGGTLLRVGPEGAGADPGPACYGRGGTEPTATDAHLLLGRLAPGPAAGGVLDLDEGRARDAVERGVGRPLGLDVEAAAIGIITILETHLRQAVETNTIERGRDPGTMTLVAAGGAGGLHGSPVARALGCPRLLVPAEAGVFCAVGMLHAPLRRDRSRSLLGDLEELAAGPLPAALEGEAAALLGLVAAEWPAGVEPAVDRHVELRYPGQLWSVRVPVTDLSGPGPRDGDPAGGPVLAAAIRQRFEAAYQGLYGHIQPAGRLEVTGVGVVATGLLEGPPMPVDRPGPAGWPVPAGRRRCWLGEPHGWADVTVFRGDELEPGHTLEGPYLIDAATTTVLGLPGDRLVVAANRDLEVELG